MDAQAHLNFLKRLRDQLDAQIADCEQAVKAQFDAAQLALPIAEEGWIEWNGRGRPVDSDVSVDIRMRDGNKNTGQAGWFFWGKCGYPSDIIAYRIAGERT